MYTKQSIKTVGRSYKTIDGMFHTKSDAKGYSYWYDKDGIKMGSGATDYLFFIGADGIGRATDKLNELVKKYE